MAVLIHLLKLTCCFLGCQDFGGQDITQFLIDKYFGEGKPKQINEKDPKKLYSIVSDIKEKVLFVVVGLFVCVDVFIPSTSMAMYLFQRKKIESNLQKHVQCAKL